jgi:penicillin amidase
MKRSIALKALAPALLFGLGALAACSDAEEKSPFPRSEVRLVTDAYGITHVYAKNDADAFYGSGYAMARDRLFQMELYRRRANGTLAEVLGRPRFKDDVGARAFDFAKLGRQDRKRMESERPSETELFRAWVAGVNARIAEVRSGEVPLPYGFRDSELGFKPELWSADDPFMVAKLLAFGLSNSLDVDLLATAMLKLAPEVVSKLPILMPAYEVFTTREVDLRTPPAEGQPTAAKVLPAPPPLPPVTKANVDLGTLPKWSFIAEEAFSNNWGITGAHTDNGRPYIAGDPHQPVSSPQRFWPFHMSSVEGEGTLDVIGFAFPGTPTVQLGHNAYVGWTATTNQADAMDIWEVSVDPEGGTVRVGGEDKPFKLRKETIKIRREGAKFGENDEKEVELRDVPDYGILLPDDLLPVPRIVLTSKDAILFNWTGFRPTLEGSAYLAMDRAKNIEEFERAADILDVGAQNFIAADKDQISYYVHASIPDRGNPSERPMPWHVMNGDDARTFWTRGELGADKMPRKRNPARGYLASANNDPWGFTADGNVENDPFYFGAFFSQGFRSFRIEQQLQRILDDAQAKSTKVTRQTMEKLQADAESPLAHTLVPMILQARAALETDAKLEAYRSRDDLKQLVAALERWDRRMTRDQAAPVVLTGVQWFAVKRVFGDALPRELFEAIAERSPPFLLGQLRNVLEGRFQGAETFVKDGRNALLFAALDDTAKWLTTRFGSADPSTFKFGDIAFTNFTNDAGGDLNAAPTPTDGAPDTINVAEFAFFEGGKPVQNWSSQRTGLYRMVIGFDAEGRVESTFTFARGASGEPGTKHFDDLHTRWVNVEHLPTPFKKDDVTAKAEGEKVLPAAK